MTHSSDHVVTGRTVGCSDSVRLLPFAFPFLYPLGMHTCTTTSGTPVPCACPSETDHAEDGILQAEAELEDTIADRDDAVTGIVPEGA